MTTNGSYLMSKATDRLAELIAKKGINFSIEVLPTAQVLITLTKKINGNDETVAGTYDDLEKGLEDCIDKLNKIAIKKSNLKVVK